MEDVCTINDDPYRLTNIFLAVIYFALSLGIGFGYTALVHYKLKQEFIILLEKDPYGYDFIDYSYKAIDVSNNSQYNIEEIKEEHIVIDLTPKGYTILYYNHLDNAFCFYNDNNRVLKYNYLETVARQYTEFYKIPDIFYDQEKQQQEQQKEEQEQEEEIKQQDNIFYNKKSKTSRISEIETTQKNSYKYLGKIADYFKLLEEKRLNLKYIGYLSTDTNEYIVTRETIYCEYKNSILNTNFSDSHYKLIDFSNTTIKNLYIDNGLDNYTSTNYNTKFFKTVDLCKELVIIEENKEDKENISWSTFKNK